MSDVKPYNSNDSKKQQVSDMFNAIAHKYDFLNHFLSLGIDKIWRRKAINNLKGRKIVSMLDVATGTGDLALASMRIKPQSIVGIDISEKMLEIGRTKIEKKHLSHIISLMYADSENLPFENSRFDAVTVAFGVRNFENLEKGISEIYRVINNGGVLVVLEFSRPEKFPFKQLYNFYFYKILPFIGRLISKDNSAYAYLPESVGAFPDRANFIALLEKTGFSKCKFNSLTFGIATIYVAEKL
jgi:demethylmenaquinone methyltransferase/2-methoxy-6-polyprenyl-1,4-benzoquinol methylase